jgi:hypothetical protein
MARTRTAQLHAAPSGRVEDKETPVDYTRLGEAFSTIAPTQIETACSILHSVIRKLHTIIPAV